MVTALRKKSPSSFKGIKITLCSHCSIFKLADSTQSLPVLSLYSRILAEPSAGTRRRFSRVPVAAAAAYGMHDLLPQSKTSFNFSSGGTFQTTSLSPTGGNESFYLEKVQCPSITLLSRILTCHRHRRQMTLRSCSRHVQAC